MRLRREQLVGVGNAADRRQIAKCGAEEEHALALVRLQEGGREQRANETADAEAAHKQPPSVRRYGSFFALELVAHNFLHIVELRCTEAKLK